MKPARVIKLKGVREPRPHMRRKIDRITDAQARLSDLETLAEAEVDELVTVRGELAKAFAILAQLHVRLEKREAVLRGAPMKGVRP